MNERTILAVGGIFIALVLFLLFGVIMSFAQTSAAQQFPFGIVTRQPVPASYSVKTKLSADQAIQIAQKSVPNSKVTAATELVIVQNKLAYQIILDRAVVYVDSDTGAIIATNPIEPAAK